MSRILIFAEAVTLAHVARPIALSRILRELGHEVCIAAAPAADRWLAGENVARQRIGSIDSTRFLRALARGLPPYDRETLKQYVDDDLRAIATWPPDIVIGDFRLSLYISARLAHKPYGAIANAYWSRRYWTGIDAPDVAPLRWLPRAIADGLFRAVYPAAFALHALPFHRACRSYGVEPPELDIRDVYTASDATAFADVEGFYEPAVGSPDAPTFIGPLAWEPPGAPPLPQLPSGPPIVFVSLGSSGARHMPIVLDALDQLPLRCIVAIGAVRLQGGLPSNCVQASEFVGYKEACALANIFVCNGGAPATYAGLAAGKPVVGIPGNLDQVLNMRKIVDLGGGRMIRMAELRSLPAVMRDANSHVVPALSRHIEASIADTPRRVADWLGRLATSRRAPGYPSSDFTE